jgi:hypothetical protein
MKRFNKEYNLTKYGSIQMKLGTINKDDPKVVYVSGRCWLTPNIEIDYNDAFEEIKKRVCRKVKSVINDDEGFSNKFIFNFDINPESFMLNKKKYFAFDIFFRQNDEMKRKLKSLIPEFESNMTDICSEMVDGLEEFGFSIEMAA